MQTKYFSPSINIKRDYNGEFHYVPTQNGERAFQKITAAFQEGTKSFNIIGAYGTGKSAFILALEKVLNNKEQFFPNPFNGNFESFETTFILGEYSSFKDVFSETFQLNKSSNELLNSFLKKTEKKAAKKKGQLIVVDEFGKFLEFAAKESPEEEMYFIQQLAEVANTPELPVLFITTLHQPFEDYALELSKSQRKEWDKVKGRLIEIPFNEPVEQLLFLAAERIAQKSFPNSIAIKLQKQLFDAIQKADVFPLRDYFNFEFAQKLFPFDILSASIATIAFQRYGQNERSLFSFLESLDYLGINDFNDGKQFYNIARLHKYLKYNFHSLLNSRFNPDSANWKALDEALQRAESDFDNDYEDASKILITIGLTSTLGRKGQKITKEFLSDYSTIALEIENPIPIIDKLESKQIIRYRNYSQSYVLFKGTDFDLNLELELAEDQVSSDFSIVDQLQKHFNFPIVPAKRVFFELGTPRYFAYQITDKPIKKVPEGQTDGFINLVFNEFISEEKIQSFSKTCDEAILFGYYENVEDLKVQITEIEKIQIVRNNCLDDSIALAELDDYLDATKEKLNESFHQSFFGVESKVKWYFNGDQVILKNAKHLNSRLSEICEKIYPYTPTLGNELMNREKLTGAISVARKNLIRLILDHQNEEDLSLEKQKFPPEKTIYLTLLKSTGIHREENTGWQLKEPTEPTFKHLWNASEDFLEECAVSPRKISELYEILKKRPFKLKQGLLDFWIPLFLIGKQKEFALYNEDTFVPQITSDTIDLILRHPKNFKISTFKLDATRLNVFNRYRYFLNQIEETNPDSNTFIETVKPFIFFYNRLVPYTRQTRSISEKAIRLRDAISQSDDPEKIFFEDIPSALGYFESDFKSDEKLEDFTTDLKNTTSEISAALSNLVNRIEDVINKTITNDNIVFPENKQHLQKRFKKLKRGHIKAKLRALHQRIDTPLEDRQSWINSIASGVVGESLDRFTDEDEQNFRDLFPKLIYELDNLTEINQDDIDKEKEEVLKLEITSLMEGVQKNLVRLPKYKSEEITKLEQKIRPLLNSKDRQANIALLIKLLQKEIENE